MVFGITVFGLNGSIGILEGLRVRVVVGTPILIRRAKGRIRLRNRKEIREMLKELISNNKIMMI